VGIVKEVVKKETSKVFWDQSRAGFPRVIAKKNAQISMDKKNLREENVVETFSFQRVDVGKVG
jgi:hypothetical protein